jgi:hypothetical protein
MSKLCYREYGIVFKISLKCLLYVCCCIAGVCLFAGMQVAPAHAAANAQVTIQPATGKPGTQVQINGSGFNQDGNVRLFITANQARCTQGIPGTGGLQSFNTNPTAQVMNGAFTVSAPWPDNAANAGTAYYICVVGPGPAVNKTLSSNTFTIAQAPSISSVTPASVAPGGQVTVTGANWLPPQPLTVSLFSNGNTVVSANVNSDANGDFTVALTIPANAQPGAYDVHVVAVNNTGMAVAQQAAVTVTQPTPTPTAQPSPTLTPTQAPTTTAVTTPTPNSTGNNTGSSGGNGGPPSALLFALGGLGVLLVIVGVILFVAYSRVS